MKRDSRSAWLLLAGELRDDADRLDGRFAPEQLQAEAGQQGAADALQALTATRLFTVRVLACIVASSPGRLDNDSAWPSGKGLLFVEGSAWPRPTWPVRDFNDGVRRSPRVRSSRLPRSEQLGEKRAGRDDDRLLGGERTAE
jgi:hypothetical protein